MVGDRPRNCTATILSTSKLIFLSLWSTNLQPPHHLQAKPNADILIFVEVRIPIGREGADTWGWYTRSGRNGPWA
jgi:hypothetical protein